MFKPIEKIESKIKQQDTDILKIMTVKLMYDRRKAADLVFSYVIDELETRLQEADFIAFCESL